MKVTLHETGKIDKTVQTKQIMGKNKLWMIQNVKKSTKRQK
jgi:hypothetical protein